MATILNRSRYTVSTKHNPELKRTFAFSALKSARAYLAKRELSAAAIELKRALDKNGRSEEARMLLGKVLLEDGDPAAAEVELRRAHELATNKDRVAPDLARAMLLVGQASKVVEQFAEVSLRDTTAHAELKAWVASAYAQLGNMQQANAQIAAALRAQPLNPAAVMVQARMRAAEGDVDGALALLDAVLEKDPGNEHVGVAKGYLLWLGKRDAAGALAAGAVGVGLFRSEFLFMNRGGSLPRRGRRAGGAPQGAGGQAGQRAGASRSGGHPLPPGPVGRGAAAVRTAEEDRTPSSRDHVL